MSDPQPAIETILDLFRRKGGSEYGGERVTQLEHALQCAGLALAAGAGDSLVAAALLHDIGHLLHDLDDNAPGRGVDDYHERLGAEWLAGRAPASVAEPVRLHVEAKRYLCAADPDYFGRLSEPSRLSLELQGGPMSEPESESFRTNPHWREAVRLRLWDDAAKIDGAATPSLEDLRGALKSALGGRA